jgi:hypothetical protein
MCGPCTAYLLLPRDTHCCCPLLGFRLHPTIPWSQQPTWCQSFWPTKPAMTCFCSQSQPTVQPWTCCCSHGPAVHPPSLSQNGLPACYVTSFGSDGAPFHTLCLKIKVCLPQQAIRFPHILHLWSDCTNHSLKCLFTQEILPGDLFVYCFLLDSFNAVLDSYSLMYTYKVPPVMSVILVIQQVVQDMQSSPHCHEFQHPLLPHESLPLQLLSLVNRGKEQPSDG